MLSMGADVGHSQSGNNNAYSQDNAISWMNWPDADVKLLAFTSRLIAIRKKHSAFRKDRFLDGRVEAEAPFRDVLWRRSDGSDLSSAEWDDGSGSTLVMVMADGVADAVDRVALVFHRGQEATNVVLPPARDHFTWTVLADTSDDERQGPVPDGALPVRRRSVLILAEISQTSAPVAAVIPLKPV
jgi:glycogen operon protein